MRDLQGKSESLFLENKTLQQEVKRLQALHPVISQLPPRPSRVARMLMRLVPGLRHRHNLALLEQSGLFDARWYRDKYPDVQKSGLGAAQHFLTKGC